MRRLTILVVAILAGLVLMPEGVANAATPCTFTTSGATETLDGDCTTDVTILVPDGFTLNGAGHTITAVDPMVGHFVGGVIENAGATANVTNLTVTASGLANACDGGADRLRGILFNGASGSITHNTVIGINQGPSGCQEGNGIEVRNAPFDGTHPDTLTVTISGNTVSDYQKNGITANGDVVATIHRNIVSGLGPVGLIAQNGIQVGFGATGSVKRNTVAGSWFTGADWTATGLLVFESDDTVLQGNEVSGSQSGIAIETWCYLGPTASDNKVIHNSISDADWGVSVAAYDLPWGFSGCDASADNNKVVNNSITATTGDTGVSIWAGSGWGGGGFSPSADNNKVIRNSISGYTTKIDVSGATASKVHANVVTP